MNTRQDRTRKQTQTKTKKTNPFFIKCIIALILCSGFYTISRSESEFARYMQNQIRYALGHNTDFGAVYQNAKSAAIQLSSVFFESGEVPVFEPSEQAPMPSQDVPAVETPAPSAATGE